MYKVQTYIGSDMFEDNCLTLFSAQKAAKIMRGKYPTARIIILSNNNGKQTAKEYQG